MSTHDLLSSTTNWPGRGLYGLRSTVLQTTESNLVRQEIVADHMKSHYRRLHNARSAVDSKPPKSMILGQKARDRARKELAQQAYTKSIIDDFTMKNSGSARDSSRGRSSQSARLQRFIQSQPVTSRARSRSVDSTRRLKRSITINGSGENFQNNDPQLNKNFFDDGIFSQALTTMAAISKVTSSERNRASADVLDKHPESFVQPNPSEHKPRLVKRDGESALINNRTHYNPPSRLRRVKTPNEKQSTEPVQQKKIVKDPQAELREQLNRSLEIRNDVENKIQKAKRNSNSKLKKQSNSSMKTFTFTEETRPEHVRFMQNLTDVIIRKELTTESAIEKLFELHVDRYGANLDQQRLRELLETLKRDLGVQSSRNETYKTLDRAIKFDQNPLPSSKIKSTGDEFEVKTPKTPHDSSRRSSFDINTPLPWQIEENSAKPSIVPRTTLQQTQNKTQIYDRANTSEDEDLPKAIARESPVIDPVIRTKEPLFSTASNKTQNSNDQSDTDSKFNLRDTDWLADPQPKVAPRNTENLSFSSERRPDSDDGDLIKTKTGDYSDSSQKQNVHNRSNFQDSDDDSSEQIKKKNGELRPNFQDTDEDDYKDDKFDDSDNDTDD